MDGDFRGAKILPVFTTAAQRARTTSRVSVVPVVTVCLKQERRYVRQCFSLYQAVDGDVVDS